MNLLQFKPPKIESIKTMYTQIDSLVKTETYKSFSIKKSQMKKLKTLKTTSQNLETQQNNKQNHRANKIQIK